MYEADAGIEELLRRLDDEGSGNVAVAWLAHQMRVFIDMHPEWDEAVNGLAGHLARADDDDV